ncbi:MAG: type II toxin-antitoxin system VapC family toxin [Gracilimonas sp.]|uniref:type II toxin-antitoxin system VapC family toxin n=1 Tax=Gracilimonas sp. TaxID=1974203 RepID=UPI00375357D5|nr:type II toxin-antitoxin system VapC family toxin [Gracilimonas sp.]
MLLYTNVILYFLSGDETLISLFEDRNLVISIITEIELLGYVGVDANELKQTEKFLQNCTVINLNTDIKNKAITIRRKYSLKLPDFVILATANSMDIPLITADHDFKKVKSANSILYEAD